MVMTSATTLPSDVPLTATGTAINATSTTTGVQVQQPTEELVGEDTTDSAEELNEDSDLTEEEDEASVEGEGEVGDGDGVEETASPPLQYHL